MLLMSCFLDLDISKRFVSFFADDPTNPNLIKKLIWFVGLSILGWLLAKFITFILEKWIRPLSSNTKSSLDDYLGKNLHKPVTRLLILGAIYLAAQISIFSDKQVKPYIKIVEDILYVFLILFLAGLINAIMKSVVEWYKQDIAPRTESSLDDTLIPVIQKGVTVVIYFLAATIILPRMGVNLTGLIATAGVASLAIAFGAQAVLADIIAGVSLIMDHSFRVGDRIELKDGVIGDVCEIGLRSTRIISVDQRLVIVPNREIAGSRIINWSQPDTATKIKLKIGVAMEEDLERVKRIILDICANEKYLSNHTPASITCTGFGPYFIELLVVATVDDWRNSSIAMDQLVMKIQTAFSKEKIKLPLPLQQIQVQNLKS